MEAAGGGVDIVGDGVGAKDMGGERVDGRRGIAEVVGERDGGEGVAVGVRRGVVDDHLGRLGSCRGSLSGRRGKLGGFEMGVIIHGYRNNAYGCTGTQADIEWEAV